MLCEGNTPGRRSRVSRPVRIKKKASDKGKRNAYKVHEAATQKKKRKPVIQGEVFRPQQARSRGNLTRLPIFQQDAIFQGYANNYPVEVPVMQTPLQTSRTICGYGVSCGLRKYIQHIVTSQRSSNV